MQLYALDEKNRFVFARSASKHCNYYCIECRSVVRVRAGFHRHPHFFHLSYNRSCRQSGKSMVHLQTQLCLMKALPSEECEIEKRFDTINRIADVVWTSKKIVFEVQCSPITAQEIQARNRDYHSQGYQVVWILHDQRYNQARLTAAEDYLVQHPHYFTNIDAEGRGWIYDQYHFTKNGRRLKKLSPLRVEVAAIFEFNSREWTLGCLNKRENWKYYFEGDLVSLFLDQSRPEYCQQAQQIEEELEEKVLMPNFLVNSWRKWVVRPYSLFFQMMLERAAR